jgi:hypothetical protein
VIVEEIIPKSHRNEETILAALALILGFTLFKLILIYLKIRNQFDEKV